MIFYFLISCDTQSSSITFLDILFKVSAIIIAGINIFFAFWMFNQKKRETNQNLKKDRGLSWLKTIILDQNLKILYEKFDDIEKELQDLRDNFDDTNKEKATNNLDDIFINFRRKFIDTLLAIDDDLYEQILDKSDNLQAELYNNIYDQGINLNHNPKFNEALLNPITRTKTDIIKILYQFKD